MLCGDGDKKKASQAVNRQTPLGEAVEIVDDGSRSLPSESFVEDIPPGAVLHEVGQDEFNRFLELLTSRTGLRVKLDSKDGQARESIHNTVERQFSRALSDLEKAEDDDDAGETLEIEPPFITKLRVLVGILAKNVDERQKTLVVQNGSPKW